MEFQERDINTELLGKNLQGKYIVKRQLGKSSFYLGVMINVDPHIQVAIKVIEKLQMTRRDLQLLEKETQSLKEFESPYILKFYDIIEEENTIFVVLEYCNKGNLKTFILKSKFNFNPERFFKNGFSQILHGFQELHQKNVVHRHITPSNILVHDNSFKIGDFGFFQQLTSKEMKYKDKDLNLTIAPEVLLKKPYVVESEIYSIGVVFYFIVKGKYPVIGQTPAQIIKNILEENIDFEGMSSELEDLLKKMLSVDPSNRIKWDNIFAHNFFRGKEEDHFMNSCPTVVKVVKDQQRNQNKQVETFQPQYSYERQCEDEILERAIKESLQSSSQQSNEHPQFQAENYFTDQTANYKQFSKQNSFLSTQMMDFNHKQMPQMNIPNLYNPYKYSSTHPREEPNYLQRNIQQNSNFNDNYSNRYINPPIEENELCSKLVKRIEERQQSYVFIIEAANKLVGLNSFCQLKDLIFQTYIGATLLILAEKALLLNSKLQIELRKSVYDPLKLKKNNEFNNILDKLKADECTILNIKAISEIQYEFSSCAYYDIFQEYLKRHVLTVEAKYSFEVSYFNRLRLFLIDTLLDIMDESKVNYGKIVLQRPDKYTFMQYLKGACVYLTLACFVDKPNVDFCALEKKLEINYRDECKKQLQILIDEVDPSVSIKGEQMKYEQRLREQQLPQNLNKQIDHNVQRQYSLQTQFRKRLQNIINSM